jgi:hypothetical protein
LKENGDDDMNPTDIQKTLEKIIEIDVATVKVEQELEAIKIEKEKEMKKASRDLDLQMMKRARKLGKVERELILNEAKAEIEKLEAEGALRCQQMQDVSDHHVEGLVEEVFQELIGKRLKSRGE